MKHVLSGVLGARKFCKPMESIERGNTQDGVNKEIILYLLSLQNPALKLFDLPCGDGTFLKNLQIFLPQAQLKGADLYATPRSEVATLCVKAASSDWSHLKAEPQDVISCISGLMCFDNASEIFQQASRHLQTGGLLIVTNDNVLTVRDRLSFLFFGRLKRFKKLYTPTEGNWNVMLIQGLWKLFRQNGFELKEIRYTSLRFEDWFFLPLALSIYPIELVFLWTQKSELPMRERSRLFPFKSLLARHYIMIGQRR